MSTERGNQQGGLGIIQWWGLSPALDLTSKLNNPTGEVNILLCGAGDTRHVLETMGKLSRQDVVKRVNFFIWEPQCELYARQSLLLLAMTEPNELFTIHEKAELYLDILGNCHNRQTTADYIIQKSSVLSEMITDFGYGRERAQFMTFDQLKFKDRDFIDDQFQYWRSSADEFKVKEQWEIRSRQYLGARYDHREGDYDWKVSMQFHELQAPVIQKRHYAQWRETGLAFETFEDGQYVVPNRALASSRVLSNRIGDKRAFRGFWGDIVVGPYIAHGIESENEALFKTANKVQTHGADQISKWNVTAAVHELFTGAKYGKKEEKAKIEEVIEEEGNEAKEIDGQLHKRRERYASVKCDQFNVTFLSPADLPRLQSMSRYKGAFDLIFTSLSHVAKFPQLAPCLKPDGVLLAESAKFVLDLTKEQRSSHLVSMKQIAKDAHLVERGFSNVLNATVAFKPA